MNIRKFVSFGCMAVAAFTVSLWAQPAPIPTGANAACNASAGVDTVEAAPDDSGFRPIFDGKSLKGWWESCQSGHSSANRTTGGIWLVDSARGLLFSNQASGGAGSILMTNKSLGNYELVFDFWPFFGNDGGVFNRTTAAGQCYQSTLDYIAGSSVGGVYFENGYTGAGRNLDPYTFGANKSAINIGTGTGNWTTNTRTLGNPADYGCPANGCVVSNWTAVWDTGGWNQVRVKFYGTGASASNKVHNQSWIRKLGAAAWVPVVFDSVQFNTPANPLGFQIHGGTGSWSNQNGMWYRNIKLRPLTDQGAPIPQGTTSILRREGRKPFKIDAVSGALMGFADLDHEITVRDFRGRVLEKFSGQAGAFRHTLNAQAHGLLLLEMKTARGVEHLRISRI